MSSRTILLIIYDIFNKFYTNSKQKQRFECAFWQKFVDCFHYDHNRSNVGLHTYRDVFYTVYVNVDRSASYQKVLFIKDISTKWTKRGLPYASMYFRSSWKSAYYVSSRWRQITKFQLLYHSQWFVNMYVNDLQKLTSDRKRDKYKINSVFFARDLKKCNNPIGMSPKAVQVYITQLADDYLTVQRS